MKDENPQCENPKEIAEAPHDIAYDPWAGRDIGMKCHSCMYASRKSELVGRCRRHAPTMSGYPVIYIHADWCGDHKLNENMS